MEPFLEVGVVFLKLEEHLEHGTGPKEMLLDSLVEGVFKNPEHLHHWLHVEDVIPEDIPVGGKVEVPAIDNVPDGHISGNSCSDELRHAAHARCCVRVPQTIGQVLRCVLLYRLQVFDLSFVNQVPHHCVVEVQVAEVLPPRHKLG